MRAQPALFRGAALLAALASARAALMQQVWPNGAFAPPSAATQSQVPAVAAPAGLPQYSSIRWTGTVTSPATQLVLFTANCSGGARLWIDDRLTIDDGGATGSRAHAAAAFLRSPMVAGVAQPFRLEFSYWTGGGGGGGGGAACALEWEGNATARGPVPAAAFAPDVAPAEVQRVALRDRLVNPAVRWQTFDNPTMGAHVLMPAGLAVVATLADSAGGEELGDIIVFRRSNPALSLAGIHSANGSDYTQLSLSRWGARACDVSLQTTVVNGGADLQFLATPNGTDCARLRLLLRLRMLQERPGAFALGGDGASMVATLPGFSTVAVHALGAAPVPFVNASGSIYLALPLAGVVGYATDAGVAPIADIQANIAAAAIVANASAAVYGDLAEVYDALSSVLYWNTMYTPYEGVITPVSRGWDFGAGYVLFDWDNLFLGYMSSLGTPGASGGGKLKDIAYSNIIQIVQARTVLGFVPNFISGTSSSFDRTEPQIGAYVVREVYTKWRDAWLVELLFPALLSWNEWVWTHRRGEGSLAGADGHADLMVLGSDPTDPPCEIGGYNNMQAARYESGLDNSPMYDLEGPAFATYGPDFDNKTTHHMALYDVGMTALYLSDTEALIALAAVAGRADTIATLQARFARVQAAMNAHMWDAEAGVYTNVLYNGSFYRRWSPTSFFPLISGSASDAQAAALAASLASPAGFCYNASHMPAPGAAVLVSWWDGAHDNANCLSDECTRVQVDTRYNYIRVEATAHGAAAGPAPGLVPLATWYSAARGDTALTNSTTAPPDAEGGYSFVRVEGWAFAAPPPAAGAAWPAVNLSLWYSAARADYKVCGSDSRDTTTNRNCFDDAGYEFRGVIGWAWSGQGTSAPCRFGGNSIARGDAAFTDNDYWRGRIWGPHQQLLYWGMRRYDHVAAVRAARLVAVDMGRELTLMNWRLFHQVVENMNGVIGIGEDVGNADPFYVRVLLRLRLRLLILQHMPADCVLFLPSPPARAALGCPQRLSLVPRAGAVLTTAGYCLGTLLWPLRRAEALGVLYSLAPPAGVGAGLARARAIRNPSKDKDKESPTRH